MPFTVFDYGDPAAGHPSMVVNRTLGFGLVVGAVNAPVPLGEQLATGTIGVAYSETMNGVGGTAPYTWAFGALPAGLAGNTSTGAITGTPTTAGTTTFAVTLTDSNGVAGPAETFQITVAAPATGSKNLGFVS